MLLGVTSQNRAFFPQKLMRQIPLKYKKELFDQVKKLKTSFFGVPNTHYILDKTKQTQRSVKEQPQNMFYHPNLVREHGETCENNAALTLS